MKTIGRKAALHEKSAALCDRCGTRWPRSKLRLDAEGLLNCPQEGSGRDAVTLTKANVEGAKAYARNHDRPDKHQGRIDKETAEPIPGLTPPTP